MFAVATSSAAASAATSYTDEATFLAALSAAGYSSVSEGFEDDAVWGSARSTIFGGFNTLPSVFSQGISWTPNVASSGITTSNGASHSGSWGFLEYPHGNFVPLPGTSTTDGFFISTGAPVTAVGGWFSGQGTSPQVEILLDGTPAADSTLGSAHSFLGVIEPAGFQSVEVREQDGTFEDQNWIFGDDFTLGVPPSSQGACGDGNTDFGEQCDDGNNTDGDCCSASCLLETGSCDDGNPLTSNDQCSAGMCSGTDPCAGVSCSASDQCHDVGSCDPATGLCSDPPSPPGTACDDGDVCTWPDACNSGSCAGTSYSCDDGDVCTADACNGDGSCINDPLGSACDDGDPCTVDSCDPLLGCGNSTEPATSCSVAARTSLLIKNKTGEDKDSLKWSWKKGDAMNEVDLGTPTVDTTYSLCVYDNIAGAASLASRLDIAAGAGWQDKGNGRLYYKDKTGLFDGVYKATLRSGDAGKARAQIKAKGANFPTPSPVTPSAMFSQDPDVTVQLHNGKGVCWTSSFQPADTSKSDESVFKAKTR